MKAKDRKIARAKFLARIEAVDSPLAKELQAMWDEEETTKTKRPDLIRSISNHQ